MDSDSCSGVGPISGNGTYQLCNPECVEAQCCGGCNHDWSLTRVNEVLHIRQGTPQSALDRFRACDLIVRPLSLTAKRPSFSKPALAHSRGMEISAAGAA